ncbi:GxxExxY protein [Brumimicrobium aurantiacum]|uniref:GxxExxY protein n=1 Tax=Brumimicrobium aurantiacum TaxID=1737063 RepID=A0A3E1EYF0_9FLAO|nr:GxxExxY protein [Brumimicrobium aurantiacum]
MIDNKVTSEIIGGAIEVHKALGLGLLESAYNECLAYELELRGLNVQCEIALPIIYKEVVIDHGYRIDLLVENKIVIELKAVEKFTDVHTAQILTCMKLGGYDLGLLINFNEKLLKNGIKRFVF